MVAFLSLATVDKRLRDRLTASLQLLRDKEMAVGFDPGINEADRRRLELFLK